MPNLLNVSNNRTILIIGATKTATMLMAKDKNDKLSKGTAAAFHVVKMLEDIPKDLKDLFLPVTEDDLAQLEMNIVKWLARVQERQKVMQLQKHYGLPLRPNQTLRDVTIRLKILELKRKRKPKDSGSDYFPDKDKDNGDI